MVLAGLAAAPIVSEVRIRRAERPLTDRWRKIPVEPPRSTLLGLSFRPLQAEALGLNPELTLRSILAHPFQVLRLAAYWSRLEPSPGRFDPAELDRQLDAAESAGKQVIVGVGALKNFGYPEFFVPHHQLPVPLREGSLVRPSDQPRLLAAAIEFVTRIVERYRDRQSILAWQVEHEAVDPLGVEHSWRLSEAFVAAEVGAVRQADPRRPVLMNGFLPISIAVGVQQWWRTRDQGDSLAVAQRLADIVGVDYYPRHALATLVGRTAYLDGGRSPWRRRRLEKLIEAAASDGRRLMISEGQAEPWEAVTMPPNPHGRAMHSCPPERLIENYNACVRQSRAAGHNLYAYLFWGAEYWVLRELTGDPSYVRAFGRIGGG